MNAGAAPALLRWDRFEIDLARRSLRCEGRERPLRPRAFSVLALLAAEAGRVVSRQRLLDEVWAGLEVTDESISRCIADIRAALGEAGRDALKTIPGRGYLLAAARIEAPASTPGLPSIAVAPFASYGDEPRHALIADGFTEDITSALCRLPGFLVLARGTMDAWRGRPVDPRDLAAELGVRYVVEGSVRVAGTRLRVSAQLIDAPSAAHLWAQNYDGALDELFAIQDDIARHIAGRIEPELLVAEFGRAARKPLASLSAWECVVRALQLSTLQSEEATREADALLERALQHEPAHAQALGLQAWLAVFRAFQGWLPMPDALGRAEERIARACTVDGDELWVLLAQGMVGFATRDNARSMRMLERAVAHNPSSVNAHGLLGIAHAFGGRGDAALASIAQAMRLSPRDTYLSDHDLYLAFALVQVQRDAEALVHAAQAMRLRPGHPYPMLLVAACAGHLGRLDEGRDAVQRLCRVVPVASGRWVEATTPYVRAEDRQRLLEGLARSGLPAAPPLP